jgi:hypothetical protein
MRTSHCPCTRRHAAAPALQRASPARSPQRAAPRRRRCARARARACVWRCVRARARGFWGGRWRGGYNTPSPCCIAPAPTAAIAAALCAPSRTTNACVLGIVVRAGGVLTSRLQFKRKGWAKKRTRARTRIHAGAAFAARLSLPRALSEGVAARPPPRRAAPCGAARGAGRGALWGAPRCMARRADSARRRRRRGAAGRVDRRAGTGEAARGAVGRRGRQGGTYQPQLKPCWCVGCHGKRLQLA